MNIKYLILLIIAIPLSIYAQNYQIIYDSFPACIGIISEGNYSIAGEIGIVGGGMMTDGSYQVSSGLLLYGSHFTTDVVEDTLPVVFTKLNQNYPNPFNPETIIEFSLTQPGLVQLIIYNIKGQQIKILLNEHREAGKHQVIWDGKDNNKRNIPSGVYLYQLVIDDKSIIRKMMLLK